MAFSTKQNLSNEKFYQSTGNSLTLSGNTIIVGNIDYQDQPSFSGDNQIITKKYADDLFNTLSGGSIVYNLSSPSTVTVGGLNAGTVLTGKTSNQILESILVPTLSPTLIAPSNNFSNNQTSIQEVGVSINIGFTATFDRGNISLAINSPNFRSGLPTKYVYTGSGLPSNVTSTSLTNNQTVNTYTLLVGANSWTSAVAYSAGPQPKDSSGANFGTPLASGQTGAQTTTITGIYPYFYGKVASGGAPAGSNRPTATNTLVTGGTKVVSNSTGTISITFSSTSDDYLWFAIPATSNDKTVWFNTSLNNGSIGGAVSPGGNLFPTYDSVSVTTVLWAGITYKVYISNFQTSTSGIMEMRNS